MSVGGTQTDERKQEGSAEQKSKTVLRDSGLAAPDGAEPMLRLCAPPGGHKRRASMDGKGC